MPYSWCREPHVETQKLSRWSLTVLSRHLLLVHCQQHKHVHFMPFTMWGKECLRIWTWLPLKELIAGGARFMPKGCEALGMLRPYLSVCSDPLVLSSCFIDSSLCNCGSRPSSVVRTLSLQLTLFKVRDRAFGILGFLWATELPQLPLPCNVTPHYHFKSLRVEITERISGPWKLVSKDNIQRG